jgi:hypothetical protein
MNLKMTKTKLKMNLNSAMFTIQATMIIAFRLRKKENLI